MEDLSGQAVYFIHVQNPEMQKKCQKSQFKTLIFADLQRRQRFEATERVRGQGMDFIVAQISGNGKLLVMTFCHIDHPSNPP